MVYDFKEFTEPGKSHNPYVSIRASGQMGISSGAGKRFPINEGKHDYVKLLYEEKENIIGIKPLESATKGAIKLRFNGDAADISAKSFFDRFGISYEETNKFEAEWSDEYEMILVYLGEEI